MRRLDPTTRRTIGILGITLLLVGAAGLAFAQGQGSGRGQGNGAGHGKGHLHYEGHGIQLEAMFSRLELNEEQQAAITKIHDDAQAKHLENRKEMMRLRNELEGELLKDEPDEKAALELTEKIGDLRTVQQQDRLAVELAVREQLTPEQRDKMLLMHGGHGRGNGRGHGGRHQGHGCDKGCGQGHGRHGGDCPLEKTES